jgi:hypothetical protein
MSIGNSCKLCLKQIETNQYGAFCSSSCKQKSAKTNSKNIKKECQKCFKEFFCISSLSEVSRFCSWECRKIETSKKCEECGSDFLVNSVNHIRKRFCSAACARGGSKSHFYGLKGELSYTRGQTPWAKGKSAKTDEKLAALGKKISFKLKDKFKNGELSNAGENNPMFGKHWTEEQKDRASIMVTDRMKNGDWNTNNPKFVCGHYESKKMGKKLWHRSSLELRIMKCFDADPNVSSYHPETFPILYSKNKRYVPDFMCEYSDKTTCILECKPKFQLEIKQVQLKSIAAKEMCEKNDWKYEIYTLEDIEKYEIRLGLDNVLQKIQ